ncbi:MAG: hypothetical protein VXY90_13965, partial [Pseudomonadota bacterium]|nr:hypothetical protein [Pseudomonadota bacterium]MEC8585872.1 hypothetical protein [Pseudomonadota bacterium]
MRRHATRRTERSPTDVPPRQLVGAAATGQPEQERGAQLIAAARGSLPLRSVTQQRRGTKHHTPSRNRPPTSQPASPEPNAPPKKTRGPGAISAALGADAMRGVGRRRSGQPSRGDIAQLGDGFGKA